MISDITSARDDALSRVAAASSVDEIARLDAELLGKKGALAGLKSGLGKLSTVEEKKAAGAAVNEAMSVVEEALSERRRNLGRAEREVQLAAEALDLTEFAITPRRGRAHIVTQAWERLEDVFVGLGFQVAEGPEVETDWYNFEALNMPPSHPARSMHDTFYVDHGAPGSTVLRTHTSPVQIRVMQLVQPPIYMVMPGRVFRNETTDSTHLAVFHQIEGLVIDRGITLADLAGTIDSFTKAFFGTDFGSRLRPSYFPFTEPSAEFDIRTPTGDWLELGGCGMVHPNVLRAGGLDPEEWSGFAFGFGIDRMAKERHGVGDVREMYTNDIRFIEQF
ncbi:MAG: phenylalanine--tRNA ligase subunit alpha [Ilumatobacteraceae bacterium]|jgi:phenylalanyl-tRNA synthetase alpha chain|nr:phenylalanine--tRNA ligase subunit alpha [Actinomycetota bacterium]MDA3011420.1 phenylalanine--tRNA ligase subunit alpha [Actinomycetota bacterium]MDA3024995.1 phenylalanine--tRNA ligase subunit alpha [Actinomycetota bacterium]